MKKLAYAISAILGATSAPIFAANISGKVLDSNNNPLANVQVHIHGKDKTVLTNSNGQFTINVDADSELHISKDGYVNVRRPVFNKDASITINLSRAAIESITVYASGLHKNTLEMASPVSVLSESDIKESISPSLGETLKDIPGLSSNAYSPNSASVSIRGLTGSRVKVLQNGFDSGDVSSTGPDHANANEALSAKQIEVLRGPWTLLYGSGAIGGVINVVDSSLPTDRYDELQGSVYVDKSSVNDGENIAASLQHGIDNFSFNFDASRVRADDTKTPTFVHEGETHDEIENTFLERDTFNIGASYIGDHLVTGISYSELDSDYGIPNHEHEDHEDEHDDEHEHDDHDDEDHDDEHEEEEVFARVSQKRAQAFVNYTFHDSALESLKLKVSNTEYTLKEIEHDHIGTQFSNDTLEARLDLEHRINHIHGIAGMHYLDTDYTASGEEAFTPSSNTKSLSFFVLEETKLAQNITLEGGLRYEKTDISTLESDHDDDHEEDDHDDEHEHEHEHGEHVEFDDSFTTFSGSIGANWQYKAGHALAISIASAKRAPNATEILSNGVHLATGTYDLGIGYEIHGDEIEFHPEEIKKEHALTLDITARKFSGDFGYSVNAFYNQIDNFYSQVNTGLYFEDGHVESDDHGMAIFQYQAQDVVMYGLEFDTHYQVTPMWLVKVSGDQIWNDIKNSEYNLPRFMQNKLRLATSYDLNSVKLSVGATHYFTQNDLAQNETKGESYTLVDASIKYYFDTSFGDGHVFAKATNLSDELVMPHTSFNKESVPLAGRNLSVGVKFDF